LRQADSLSRLLITTNKKVLNENEALLIGGGTVPILAIYQQTQAYKGNFQREYFTIQGFDVSV
jgi:hypothetical protein